MATKSESRALSSVDSLTAAQEDVDSKITRQNSKIAEIDMMKERFAKLLLGEDMSGSGKGVCTALAVANAITNLCATVFGQLWRLEPLAPEKKTMWKREMNWLLSVGDHIVELYPSWQTFPDGTKLEVMTCRPRSDIFINLPALKKLDNLLLEILDTFKDKEFWYVDQGIIPHEEQTSASSSFRKTFPRQEEKWWLPVPRVPAQGLSGAWRRQLVHSRECANQILKAAMAINSNALSEMDVPESYWEALPKNAKGCLGELIYRYITSENFSSECLLDCLDLSSEHVAVELANRIESAIHVWRRPSPNRSTWGMVKDLMADADKREMLAERAECLLSSLKRRFPNLTQTSLDTSKIQFNKDVGKAILESYSRVLESLASNIVARIEDLLYVDDFTKRSSFQGKIKKVIAVTPPPKLSTSDRTPFANKTNVAVATKSSPLNQSQHRIGFGVKKALSNYLHDQVKRSM